MKRAVLFCLLAAVTVTGIADAGDTSWEVSGQIRHRFEVDNRDYGTADAETYGLLRSRLNVEFTSSDKVSAFVQLQDSRFMGEELNTLSDASADNLDFHQAYVTLKDLFGMPVDARLGRMELNLGPQRLVGAVGWTNTARSFDGLTAKVKGETASAQLFYFTEREFLRAGDDYDRRIFGAYGEIVPMEHHAIHPFLIWQVHVPNDEMTSSGADLSRYTLGFDADGKRGGFWHRAEFAYQGGERTTVNQSVDFQAYMAALNLAYIFKDQKTRPKVTAGVDYLSGDDDLGDDKVKVFDTLYATNHKYYGFMDQFLNIPTHTLGSGLLDVHGGAAIKPGESTALSAMFHLFRAAEDLAIGGGETSKAFGQELDLTLKHAYAEGVSFTVGASIFIPGEVFEAYRGEDAATWAYLMTTVNL